MSSIAAEWESWPAPFCTLAARRVAQRQIAWDAARTDYLEQREAQARVRALNRIRIPTAPSPALPSRRAELDGALRRMDGISRERPCRPTWIGDRLGSTATRFERIYDLDLETAWPHLWRVMPGSTRDELMKIRRTLASAAVLAAWGVLYLVPSLMWWPGLALSATAVISGYRRARIAATLYAESLEAEVLGNARELAAQLGINRDRPLDRQTGWAITCLLQGHTDSTPLSHEH